MTVTRATTNVIVVEAAEEDIRGRHRAGRQALGLLDLGHFDHHLAQAEAVFSNLAESPHNLARVKAMRDRTASSLEAMESRLQDLEQKPS